jgi:hypothetical protein
MAAIFLFYLPFFFFYADMFVNNAGVSENELQGLTKTAVFSDTNNVGTPSGGRHFTLRCTTLCCYFAYGLYCCACPTCSSVYVLTKHRSTSVELPRNPTCIQNEFNTTNPQRPSSDTTISRSGDSHVQELARVLYGLQA